VTVLPKGTVVIRDRLKLSKTLLERAIASDIFRLSAFSIAKIMKAGNMTVKVIDKIIMETKLSVKVKPFLSNWLRIREIVFSLKFCINNPQETLI
jgi:hypothetical protein